MTVNHRLLAIGILFAVLAIGAGCSGARLTGLQDTAYTPSGSASDATLPPPVVRVLSAGSEGSEFVRTAAPGDVPPPPPSTPRPGSLPSGWTTPPPTTWSPPAPVTRVVPAPMTGPTTTGFPPPPPPPYDAAPGTTTVVGPCPPPCPPTSAPVAPTPAPAAAVPLAQRRWAGCGLPCEDGISTWHIRGVGGVSFYFGDDSSAEPCTYWGADIGRTFCGCWGLDLYWRLNSAQFDRWNEVCLVEDHDGGYMNHFGAKLTMEHAFGQSRWYWWIGLGGGYFITTDFLDDDEGWEAFGELGIGYVLSERFRVRLGVNAHLMDTHVGRYQPADDGDSRLLWVVAPVFEVQVDF